MSWRSSKRHGEDCPCDECDGNPQDSDGDVDDHGDFCPCDECGGNPQDGDDE